MFYNKKFSSKDFFGYIGEGVINKYKSFGICLLLLTPYINKILNISGLNTQNYTWIIFLGLFNIFFCANKAILSKKISYSPYFWWLLYSSLEFATEISRIYLANNTQIISNLGNIFQILRLLLSAFLVYYFIFLDNEFLNSYYQTLGYQGTFDVKSNKFLIQNKRINYEKLKYIGSIIYFSIFIVLVVLSLINLVISLLQTNTSIPENQAKIDQSMGTINIQKIILWIFLVLVFAPVNEEILYRRILMRMTGNNNISILCSGIVFALIHLSNKESWTIFLLYFPTSIMFSFLYWKYRNIFLNMGVHSIWNFMALIITWIKKL